MDWSGCDLVEVVPGKVSGQPIIKGTRILAEAFEQHYEFGTPLSEIREDYPALSDEMILRLLDYVKTHDHSAG